MRYLTWYIETPNENKAREGPTFILDKDYDIKALRMYSTIAPDGDDLEIDILDDGSTIFGSTTTTTDGYVADVSYTARADRPMLQPGEHDEVEFEGFRDDDYMEEGSEVYLQFVSTGGAKGVTVILEIE